MSNNGFSIGSNPAQQIVGFKSSFEILEKEWINSAKKKKCMKEVEFIALLGRTIQVFQQVFSFEQKEMNRPEGTAFKDDCENLILHATILYNIYETAVKCATSKKAAYLNTQDIVTYNEILAGLHEKITGIKFS